MATYLVLANVDEGEFQNTQELAAIWGDVAADIEELGGRLRDSYAVMGGYDFVLVFETDDAETALQAALATERYGVDTTTMRLFPVDRLGELVDDV